MSFLSHNEPNPTEKVTAPEGVRREVAPEAAARFEVIFKATEKVNATANSMAQFIRQPSEVVGGMIATGAATQPRQAAPQEVADSQEIIDSRLGYAKYNALAYPEGYDPIAEAEEITRQAVAPQSPAFEPQMPRSEYEMLTEATEYGPQVPQEEVGIPTQLHAEVVADRKAEARRRVDDAYELAA